MRATPEGCFHLSADTVREIHSRVIAQFGGIHGVRDSALIESAIGAAQATFGGKSVYIDVVEIAAAYLYFLCRNHPFLDGNKRAALGACLVFLRLNGIEPQGDGDEWEELTVSVAAGAIDRDAATERLRRLIPEQSS